MVDFIPAAKPIIGDEERAAVDRVLRSGMIAQGPEVAEFEREFSRELLDGCFAVAVNSGTSGLHLGLLAAGIGPGHEVIVPSFTFAATANAVRLAGAQPVFADIDLDTYTLDPQSVRGRITSRTKAILPVHLYGHPAHMDDLQKLCTEFGLFLLEDAAQAHGASWGSKKVGTFGTFAMFSLYPTKNMTSGEGGIISTRHPDLQRRARLLRNQGMEVQYQNELVGFNNRMTDIHAAIGRIQLSRLAGWTEARQSNAAYFDRELSGVITPAVSSQAVHVYHQYTVRLPQDSDITRDEVVRRLKEDFQVGAGVYYPVPVHKLEAFREGVDLPQTETAAQGVFSLPVHPSLSEGDRGRIVSAVNTVVKGS